MKANSYQSLPGLLHPEAAGERADDTEPDVLVIRGTSKSMGPEIIYFRVWIYLDRDPQSASIVPRNPDGTKHECPRPY